MARPAAPDRSALYGQAAAVSTRASELAAELGGDVGRQTDAAVYAVHRAALQVAVAVEHGHPRPDIGVRLATAAGPGHQAIVLAETRWLERSLAAHPDQGRYVARTGRRLGAIPGTVLGIGLFALLGMARLFPRIGARHGARGALEIATLVLLALPCSWLVVALSGAITGWPGRGWPGFVLWLGLFFVPTVIGPRLLPRPLRRGWFVLFGSSSRQTMAPPVLAAPAMPRLPAGWTASAACHGKRTPVSSGVCTGSTKVQKLFLSLFCGERHRHVRRMLPTE